MQLTLATHVLHLPLRDPFRIARREDDRQATTVIVELEAAGLTGIGEAFPVAYYGETVATVGVVLPLLAEALGGLADPPTDAATARAWLADAATVMADTIGGHGGARAGLDIALHDLVARGLGLPLWQLLEAPATVVPTDFSIGIDEPAVVAERAARAADFPALKIKVGGAADLETLEAVRGVFAGPLRVDANTGWDQDEALRLVPELERLGVELIEQPFPARALPQLRWLQERCPIPVVADESAVTIDDLEALTGVVAGVNVKLAKCGGVGPALAMIRRARELGFRVMLGCMEETSVGIAASATLSGLVDWVDLDGNLLLARDPFEGLVMDAGRHWLPGTEPGLGLRWREDDTLS
ncbi:MAG: dipeptide epimerase [Chloroflexi bacterium]|nr:dipeptide epimerase [Chloroflexota bacterium]